MTDTMTPEQRHRCMSHIRSKATKPELLVRQWLWSHGYRYRLNVKSVPGKPDIVLRPYRTAIFVNGCFWSFWLEKIRRNQERDQRNYALLQDNGWQVIVVWECQLKPDKIERTMREVELALNNNLLSLYKHNPLPYSTEEDEPLPQAAEEATPLQRRP